MLDRGAGGSGFACGIWDIPGVQTLGLSTNALLLPRLAEPLRRAGMRSVNISLDTLDPVAYRRAIANKPEHHGFAEDFAMQRPITAIGG